MEFGSVLKRMRRGAGLTQFDMAAELNIERTAISRMENNKTELKAEFLVKWCRITNNPDVLMAFIYGTDIVTTIQPAGQLITGTILLLGGLL